MDRTRRRILSASGALLAASLAGCAGQEAPESTPSRTPSATDTASQTDTGTATEESNLTREERLERLATDNAAFALDLHRSLADETGGNVFVSPYSISSAIAMAYAGAHGETRAQIQETLHYSLEEEVHPAFDDLEAALDERGTVSSPDSDDEVDGFQLDVANAAWGQAGEPFKDEYLDLLESHYGAGLRPADFTEAPETERQRINEWVAERTDGRIDELLPQGSISKLTRLVLTNAIYFLATWQSEFDPDDTEPATFTALDGSESTVPMMRQGLRTDYASLDGAEAIELPYVGGDVSMVLILPDDGAFESFEASLDAETLFEIFDSLGDASGDIRLPRFEYRTKLKLSDQLSALGMPRPFDEQDADFSGMHEAGEKFYIDDVYHEAFVAVDEEGTEATGATAVVTNVTSAPPQSFDLTFDRPFLFCIRDRPTDAVLFLGRVIDAVAAQPA